jgi:hypothetical protein
MLANRDRAQFSSVGSLMASAKVKFQSPAVTRDKGVRWQERVGHDEPLLGFIAEKRLFKFRFPEAATRH